MGLHQKHAPMDVLVHSLLFYSMLAGAICAAAEAAWRESALLTAGRIAGTFLQGAWFLAAAHVMYESACLEWGARLRRRVNVPHDLRCHSCSILGGDLIFWAWIRFLILGHSAWDTGQGTDMAPVMFLPALYVCLVMLIILGILAGK